MARYYLHLRDGTSEVLDEVGEEFTTLEALQVQMVASARDLITGDVRRGVLDLRFRIDAEDEAGHIVYSLPFKQALTIIPEGNVGHAG